MPVADPDPAQGFRFGTPPLPMDPTGTYTTPISIDEPAPEAPAREPIALLQYWPVIAPGVVALISGLLIVVELLK